MCTKGLGKLQKNEDERLGAKVQVQWRVVSSLKSLIFSQPTFLLGNSDANHEF